MIIRSNYSPGEAKVALSELSQAAGAARLRGELVSQFPSLAHNPLFLAMLP